MASKALNVYQIFNLFGLKSEPRIICEHKVHWMQTTLHVQQSFDDLSLFKAKNDCELP